MHFAVQIALRRHPKTREYARLVGCSLFKAMWELTLFRDMVERRLGRQFRARDVAQHLRADSAQFSAESDPSDPQKPHSPGQKRGSCCATSASVAQRPHGKRGNLGQRKIATIVAAMLEVGFAHIESGFVVLDPICDEDLEVTKRRDVAAYSMRLQRSRKRPILTGGHRHPPEPPPAAPEPAHVAQHTPPENTTAGSRSLSPLILPPLTHPPDTVRSELLFQEKDTNTGETGGNSNSTTQKGKKTTEKRPKVYLDRETWSWHNITDQDRVMWHKAYPACDLDVELAKMAAWCRANGNKGVKSNWHRFITHWLSKSQDKGGTNSGNGQRTGFAGYAGPTRNSRVEADPGKYDGVGETIDTWGWDPGMEAQNVQGPQNAAPSAGAAGNHAGAPKTPGAPPGVH